MNTRARLWILAASISVPLATVTLRAEDDSADTRLRQTLRDTMLQLRQAQTDLANLQAAQAAQADDEKALKDQIALMTKHSADDHADSAKATEALKAKVAADEAELTRVKDLLSQWKAAAEKLSTAARTAEVQKSKAETGQAFLTRESEDLKTKNQELYRIGSEILDRYQKFSLGDQFLAKEPFIGRARSDLENQVQDYSDELLAQKATQ